MIVLAFLIFTVGEVPCGEFLAPFVFLHLHDVNMTGSLGNDGVANCALSEKGFLQKKRTGVLIPLEACEFVFKFLKNYLIFACK